MSVQMLLMLLAAAIVGCVLGALAAALRAARRERALAGELEAARARLQSQEEIERERLDTVTRAQEQLKLAFEELAGATLRNHSELFLKIARENLGQQHLQSTHALKEREAAIQQLVKPIQQALEKTGEQIAAIEKERHASFAELRAHLEAMAAGQNSLQRETRNLVTALRRPEVRGQWGELSLRRLVELAGMTAHCDFTEQVHTVTESGSLRPDMVVHMIDERDIVVDVKTPLDAYLEAMEAPTEELRAAALRRHGQIVAERVRTLASKSYWSQFERSPDFVVLFIPGDQFLAAALNERPGLVDEALRQSVILATPTNFIALLKTIAYGWRQLALAQNAETIRELGEDLYRRLSTFGSHLAAVGRGLNRSVEAYNAAVGSLERQVLPGARRFTELGLKPDRALETLEPVQVLARDPTVGATGTADDDD